MKDISDSYVRTATHELSRDFESSARWLNCFACCTRTLKLLGHVMILFVMGLVMMSWYTVVIVVYGPMLFRGDAVSVAVGAVVTMLLTAVVAMILWSYFACVCTDPGHVPDGWHPFMDDGQARIEFDRLAYSDYYYDRRDPRRPRFCKKCQAWKPERSHHCSTSGRCILKLDHWCVWVMNAIGLLNYKFFCLFLFYTFLGALLGVLLLLKPILHYFNNLLRDKEAPMVFMAIVFDGAFVICLAGFLVMHGQLILANCTTIEMYEKERISPWPYNRGMKKNFEEVFGHSKLRWFLPMITKEERKAMLESCLAKRPSSFAPHSQANKSVAGII